MVNEKIAEAAHEPEGLDPETARIFENVRVAAAWSRFQAAISPPASVVVAHARAGLSRRSVGRLVGLGSRALGQVFSGEKLVETLDAARGSGRGEGPPRSDRERAWCWSAARSQVLGFVFAVTADEKTESRIRVEALFAALAFAFLEPGFLDASPSAARELIQLVPELREAIGGEGVRVLSELLRRPLGRRDVAHLERLYARLAPHAAEPSRELRRKPGEQLLVTRHVIARVLGVDPRTITAWRRRPGFPQPLQEGNRQKFCAASVAQWAHENGHVFDLGRLPRDVRDRIERARDLAWLEDREAKRAVRETALSREAFVAKKCRDDEEQIAEAAERAEGRSSA